MRGIKRKVRPPAARITNIYDMHNSHGPPAARRRHHGFRGIQWQKIKVVPLKIVKLWTILPAEFHRPNFSNHLLRRFENESFQG